MSLGVGAALGFSLAMDAFAVSCAIPFCVPRVTWIQALRVAGAFGIFQMGMPLLGWVLADVSSAFIQPVDHWIAFILLAVVGGKMILEGLKAKAECPGFSGDPTSGKLLLILALGTSIDAMAVGVSFTSLKVHVSSTVLIIGAITFLLSLAGLLGSKRLCGSGGGRWEIIGGLVLLGIGAKILAEHVGLI